MKKWILLILVVALAYTMAHRRRLYVRDAMATVTRNGVKEDGAQVYINYANDVLIENDHAPAYTELVQHGGHIGTPSLLRCLHFVVCETDADVASMIDAEPARDLEAMSAKQVEFIDFAGRHAVVTLH